MNRRIMENIKKEVWMCIIIVVIGIFCVYGSKILEEYGVRNTINLDFIESDFFRNHNLDATFICYLQEKDWSQSEHSIGEEVGLYLVNTFTNLDENFGFWEKAADWKDYVQVCESIWGSLMYFPVALSSVDEEMGVSFGDTWGDSRTYGGQRLHEGTDIMATIDETGLYPVISITDGIVTKKGWLEQGGYRIGITSESGVYFYYAHLESYSNLEIGDSVMGGQLLGYMGDSGYGEEGTTGMFPVHLHMGVYLSIENEEVSINPYWILEFLERNKLMYSYEYDRI